MAWLLCHFTSMANLTDFLNAFHGKLIYAINLDNLKSQSMWIIRFFKLLKVAFVFLFSFVLFMLVLADRHLSELTWACFENLPRKNRRLQWFWVSVFLSHRHTHNQAHGHRHMHTGTRSHAHSQTHTQKCNSSWKRQRSFPPQNFSPFKKNIQLQNENNSPFDGSSLAE